MYFFLLLLCILKGENKVGFNYLSINGKLKGRHKAGFPWLNQWMRTKVEKKVISFLIFRKLCAKIYTKIGTTKKSR
jgi:hypothetical protein